MDAMGEKDITQAPVVDGLLDTQVTLVVAAHEPDLDRPGTSALSASITRKHSSEEGAKATSQKTCFLALMHSMVSSV